MPETLTLSLDSDTAQDLSVLLGKLARQGMLEADLVELRAQLNAKRVELGWLSPSKDSAK